MSVLSAPLLMLSCLTVIPVTPLTTPNFLWRFSITETWTTNNQVHSVMQGTADCPPAGCQQALYLNFTLSSLTPGYRPALCFLYDQTHYNCRNYWQEANVGCPYPYCNIHQLGWTGWGPQMTASIFTQDENTKKYRLLIKDPWDSRWASGVKGGLYSTVSSSYPTATIRVIRTYVQQIQFPKNVQALQNLTTVIKQREQKLQEQLNPPNNKDPFSWLALIRLGLNLSQAAGLKNLSQCFLCATLGKAPFLAVPLPAAFNTTNDSTSSLHSAPLSQVPLYHNPQSLPLPFCYSTPNSSWCHHTQAPNKTQMAPLGGYFWCNHTLSKTLNHTSLTQSLCVPVSLVPSLTLYGKGELSELTSQLTIPSQKIQKRAIFLPLVTGLSLASSLVASGLGPGDLAYSIQSTQTLSTQLQAAIDASTESLASLQRQITSVAQVAARNRRALDFLTAEKGGTCLFLGEECCYYINESGLVETRIQKLKKISKELQESNSRLVPGTLVWLLPFLIPILILCIILCFAAIFIKFLRARVQENYSSFLQSNAPTPLHPTANLGP
ncbi:endogenous retrovirus group FC1 Env polyprotein [Piliocolobus tephrosceles]|uniref:ERV-BabFcenv provirus ancestral Env polyprotein n=1 Tax=Piliocolobus tephrosceles TaxID=591936 RepID=A0A8C9IUV7_9PRIM|nr:endogenous retrovirus group FC1 Env polyprotein [Piliocolobus tephrosceles]